MKKTFKHFLTESQKLPHWPKTKDELIKAYQKVMIDQDTGEVMMPPYYDDDHPAPENLRQWSHTNFAVINDDLTVSIKNDRSRVQIQNWMLVDGKLPFPFKDVDMEFNLGKGCRLKSLAGVPKTCESFCIWQEGIDGISNLVGGPEKVEESYTVQLCESLTSTAGLPKSIPGGRLELTCTNLQDFSHLPTEVHTLVIGHSPYFTHEDFKYLPSEMTEMDFSLMKNLHSLHKLSKYVKRLYKLGLYEVKINSSILSLAMIDDLKEVDEYFYDINSDDQDWPTDGIIQIVNKYLGTHDVFEFQEELVEAGFKELAKQ